MATGPYQVIFKFFFAWRYLSDSNIVVRRNVSMMTFQTQPPYQWRHLKMSRINKNFNPFPHIDTFWRLCSRRLFENIVTKEEIAQNLLLGNLLPAKTVSSQTLATWKKWPSFVFAWYFCSYLCVIKFNCTFFYPLVQRNKMSRWLVIHYITPDNKKSINRFSWCMLFIDFKQVIYGHEIN